MATSKIASVNNSPPRVILYRIPRRREALRRRKNFFTG